MRWPQVNPCALLLSALALSLSSCAPSPAIEGGACEKAQDCAEGFFCLGRVCRQDPAARHEAGDDDGGSRRDAGPDGDTNGIADSGNTTDGGTIDGGGGPGDAEVDAGCRSNEQCGQDYACDRLTGRCEGVGRIQVDPEMIDPGCPVGPGVEYDFSVNISNVGKGLLTILDIRVEEGQPPDGGPPLFAVNSPRQPPFGLAENESVAVTVVYRPDDRRPDSGALIIQSDDPKHAVIKVPIKSGYKSAPSLAIVDRSTTPPTVLYPVEGSGNTFDYDLGEVVPGESISATLSLMNALECGDAMLAIEQMTVSNTGLNKIGITLRSPDDPPKDLVTPVYLFPGEMVDIAAEYAPTVLSDVDQAELSLKTNDDDVNDDGHSDEGTLSIQLPGHARIDLDGGMDLQDTGHVFDAQDPGADASFDTDTGHAFDDAGSREIFADKVTAGTYHSCAVTDFGGAMCWGNNTEGGLGDGTTTSTPVPVSVSGLSIGLASISAGLFNTCAVTASGGVNCWGWNGWGQLGGETTTNATTPVEVPGLSHDVATVATGIEYACAITTSGGVRCWGRNDYGQLGRGTRTEREPASYDVAGLSTGAALIATGWLHACAVTTAGGVKCWGWNGSGQLGDGTTLDRLAPADVVGLDSGVSAIAAGGVHTCAVTSSRGVKCWGDNINGQLGDRTTSNKASPVETLDLSSGVASVAAGDVHTCALTTVGAVKCWGSGHYGRLGVPAWTEPETAPVDVVGLEDAVTMVAAGGAHTCAATISGGLKCWGFNSSGQLGDGTRTDRHTPVDVVGFGP